MKHFALFTKSLRYSNANKPRLSSKEELMPGARVVLFITINVLFLSISAFAQQLLEIQARPSTEKSDIGSPMEKSLAKYNTYQLDSRAIYAHAKRNEGSSFALSISFGEDRKLEMILEPSKVHESDFSFLTNTSQRIEVEKNITYKGYLRNAPKVKVRMTIAEHYIAGYIMDEKSFAFETPYNKEKQAIIDKVIAYSSADFLNAQESACGHIASDTENGGNIIPEMDQPSQNTSGKPSSNLKNVASNTYCPKLSIVLDHQGLAVAGSIAKFNTDLQTIMNIVNGYYDDFSVEYKLNPVHFISSAPNPWADAPRNEARLTSNFRSWAYPNLTPTDYNCALLFTGTDMRGIGYAYYGHMCPSDSYRYGEIDYRFVQPITQRANITAHELGHLWGAQHVSQTSIHIMAPRIYNGNLQWGTSSYNVIYNAVNNTYKSCLPQCTATGSNCNAPYTDNDNDGYCSDVDCNDSNGAINPGAAELCDGIDNNCNGQIDEGVLKTYYRDADKDGYGNASQSIKSCSLPVGYVTNNTDCNDSNAAINPGAAEPCDGIDNNCNGQIDEGTCGYCIPIHLRSQNELITRVTLSNLNNTSGGWNTSTTGYSDYTNLSAQVAIGGTYTITVTPNFSFPYSKVGIWADWNQNFVFDPGEKIASFSGQGPWTASFSPPANASLGTTRLRIRLQYGASYVPDPCAYSNFYSGETEDYSLQVVNCINQTYYADADNDGYGNAGQSIQACSIPVGYVANNTDCNDANAAIKPGAAELCDGIDNNCNGQIDEAACGYCTPIHQGVQHELITNVTVSNINNASGGWNTSTVGYSDYTNLVAQVAIGGTYSIIVTPNFSFPDSKVGIWADWNQNFVFDAGENIASFSGVGPWTASFTPPANAVLGTTRLRVRLQYSPSYTPDPCAYSYRYSGETEDYSLNVVNQMNKSYFTDAYSEERYDLQLYPNPNFTPDLVVDVKSPEAVKEVEVRLLDVYGKVIRIQKIEQIEAGSNKIRMETADLPAGAYYIKIIGIDQLQRPRMFIRSGS